MNIDDLELKSKNDKFLCDETSSSSSSFTLTSPDICTTRTRRTFDKLPGHSMEKGDHEDLSSFRREIQDGNCRRETLLDQLCDAIVESKPVKRISPQVQNGVVHSKHDKMNGKVNSGGGLDQAKKSNLLAVLKNIDDES